MRPLNTGHTPRYLSNALATRAKDRPNDC